MQGRFREVAAPPMALQTRCVKTIFLVIDVTFTSALRPRVTRGEDDME